ncbi:MAG: hypothetical protein M0Z45_00395 [Actinomycetota bacterium]|nr:hypothetical protein [Actinomycetota bacterium]
MWRLPTAFEVKRRSVLWKRLIEKGRNCAREEIDQKLVPYLRNLALAIWHPI